jgi:hypothetical protein
VSAAAGASSSLFAAVARRLYALTLGLVWRSEMKVARKLLGFSATEAGSALDMLKAAELCGDPALRRPFFRHAMDEARHARLFADEARRIARGAADGPHDGRSELQPSDYDGARAARQDLFARLGLVRFIAFVHLAERRGQLQFAALERHFRRRGRAHLADLFARIGRDERFHVAYSATLLDRFRADGHAAAVRWALGRVRLARALAAWRSAGRVAGDLLGRAVLGVTYLVLLAPFALLVRRLDPARTGWRPPPARRRAEDPLAAARRQA